MGWLGSRDTLNLPLVTRPYRRCSRKRTRWDIALAAVASALGGVPRVRADIPIIAISLPPTVPAGSLGLEAADDGAQSLSEGYVFLSEALESAMQLAVDDINAGVGSTESLDLKDKLFLTFVKASTTTAAMEGLCSELSAARENGTFGAMLLESLSNEFLGIPIVTPLAAAARGTRVLSSQGGAASTTSYLVGIQPDIFAQMRALVTLMLQMKAERDSEQGWSFAFEEVFVVHTDDQYGSTAAVAFKRATAEISREAGGITLLGGFDSATRVHVKGTFPIATGETADLMPALESIIDREGSIFVLLAEGYEGRLIRAILTQAVELGLADERSQWYLPDAAAMDGVFDVNETYRDSQLAYDLRGTLGVRPCPPYTGPDADELDRLTSTWVSLDDRLYPGAGPGSLTVDGLLESWVAFAYDSVLTLAAAIQTAQESLDETGGDEDASSLEGLSFESCPFSSGAPTSTGEAIRDAAITTDLVGVTGSITMSLEQSSSYAGEEMASGWRASDGGRFCAVNLQAHASLGAAFVTTMTWDSGGVNASQGFQDLSPFQKNQTFPNGDELYPSDRPTLQGMHLEVVTQAAAEPFVIVTGNEEDSSDYEGIVMLFLQELSERLDFSYNLTVVDDSMTTNDVVMAVAEGTFDMAASWVTITEGRSEDVSFSYPYYDVGIVFVYKPAVDTGVSWTKAFTPFEPSLWLAIVLALVLTIFLLWLFEGAKNDQFALPTPSAKLRRHFTTGISNSAYVTVSLMLGQLTHKPETTEGYILTAGWLFACFIFAASFTAELSSFLTAEREAAVGISVEDLQSGMTSHTNVALLQGGTLQSFYEREIMQCKAEACDLAIDQPQKCGNLQECFDMLWTLKRPQVCYFRKLKYKIVSRVLDGEALVTIMDSASAEYEVLTDYCGLALMSETYFPQHYGLVVPKDSTVVVEIDRATLELRDDGSLEDMASEYFENTECASSAYVSNSQAAENLSLSDLAGVFLVLGVFIVLSFTVWISRTSLPDKRTCKRYSTQRAAVTAEKEEEVNSRSSEWEKELEEVDLPLRYARMSRRQKQSFAFEAVVELLEASRKEMRKKACEEDIASHRPVGRMPLPSENGSASAQLRNRRACSGPWVGAPSAILDNSSSAVKQHSPLRRCVPIYSNSRMDNLGTQDKKGYDDIDSTGLPVRIISDDKTNSREMLQPWENFDGREDEKGQA